jgi:hypothetical protein
MAHGKFGTAINCMDGRAQLPVINWMKEKFHLDYVDMITEPGADKAVGEGWFELIEEIKTKALISVNAHGSRIIVIAGHYDCAGNPVTPEQHKMHITEAVGEVISWNLPLDKVIGVWLNKDWQVEIVSQK